MAARAFNVASENSTVACATLIFVHPAAAVNPDIEFLRFWVSDATAAATSAQQRIAIVTQASSFPTLTGVTPNKLNQGEPNASVIVSGTSGQAGQAGVTSSADNGGTKTTLWPDAFNILNGYLLVPIPEERIIMPASHASGLGLTVPAAPGTTTGWSYGLTYREV